MQNSNMTAEKGNYSSQKHTSIRLINKHSRLSSSYFSYPHVKLKRSRYESNQRPPLPRYMKQLNCDIPQQFHHHSHKNPLINPQSKIYPAYIQSAISLGQPMQLKLKTYQKKNEAEAKTTKGSGKTTYKLPIANLNCRQFAHAPPNGSFNNVCIFNTIIMSSNLTKDAIV